MSSATSVFIAEAVMQGIEANVAEYVDQLNLWVDTTGSIDEEAMKGNFLTAVGKEAFALLRTLFNPKTLSVASIADIQQAFL